MFENGGRLYLLNLTTEKYDAVNIQVLTDRATLKPRIEDVTRYARQPDISPNGKRAVFSKTRCSLPVATSHNLISAGERARQSPQAVASVRPSELRAARYGTTGNAIFRAGPRRSSLAASLLS